MLYVCYFFFFFFFSSRRRHTRSLRDWSSDVCSSDLSAGSCSKRRAGPPAPTHWSSDRVTPPVGLARGQTSARIFPVLPCALRMPTSFRTLLTRSKERRKAEDRSCTSGTHCSLQTLPHRARGT